MAKYRRRRYTKKSTRWSSNIVEIGPISNQLAAGPTFASNSITLVTNPVQNSLTTSTIYTVKNIEGAFTMETSDNDLLLEAFTAYLMYLPQGMTVTSDYNIQHPEYILAYKFYGSPSSDADQQYQPIKIKTRLARKLNTGDSIILFVKAYNQASSQREYVLQGVVRWWTKSN